MTEAKPSYIKSTSKTRKQINWTSSEQRNHPASMNMTVCRMGERRITNHLPEKGLLSRIEMSSNSMIKTKCPILKWAEI